MGDFYRPFDHFFEGVISTASSLSRGASHIEQCRWRWKSVTKTKNVFSLGPLQELVHNEIRLHYMNKAEKNTWICKWLVSKKNLNCHNRKTIFQGNGWHRRIESRVLHPHLQKSKETSVGVNEYPSHQTLSDVTKLCLEFPIYVLHTLAYLFVPLTKRKMTF